MENTLTVNDFVDKYITAIKSRLRSYAQRAYSLQRIVKFFDKREVYGIGRADFELYCENRLINGVTPASINVELSAYSAAISYAQKRWQLDLQNPVTDLFFPQNPGRLRYIEKEEAARLIDKARKSRSTCLSDFIELALNTGARKNELLQLQFKSVDLTRLIITIEGHTTKTGKRRYLPMNKAAQQIFKRRQSYREQNCPISPWVFSKRNGDRVKYLDNTFRLAVEQAGIEDFHVHDLRHTFASWLVSEGVELIKVRDLLGHSSIRMTERYAHLAPHRLHDAVSVLDGLYMQSALLFEP